MMWQRPLQAMPGLFLLMQKALVNDSLSAKYHNDKMARLLVVKPMAKIISMEKTVFIVALLCAAKVRLNSHCFYDLHHPAKGFLSDRPVSFIPVFADQS